MCGAWFRRNVRHLSALALDGAVSAMAYRTDAAATFASDDRERLLARHQADRLDPVLTCDRRARRVDLSRRGVVIEVDRHLP